jgi:hypothetical protein
MPHRMPRGFASPLIALGLFLSAGCTGPSGAVGTPGGGGPTPTLGGAPLPGITEAAITPDDIRHRIGLLAHDSMRGRDTGSPEKAQAAEYLASEVRRLGLVPAGDRGASFFQAVPLVRRQTALKVTLEVAASGGEAQGESGGEAAKGWLLKPGDDLVLISGLGGLPATSRASAGGPLIFGGHLYDPDVEPGTLSFQDLSGGMVIVRMEPPEGLGDPALLPPRMELAFLFGPASPAAGVILVAEGDLEDFFPYAADTGPKGAVARVGAEEPDDVPPFFLITPEALERLLGSPLSEARAPRVGLGNLDIELETRTSSFEDRNVVAILPGSNPALRGEFMTLGAHYDHVGVGAPVDGDSIFNGADDNASGTTALLEVAEYLAHLPEADRPQRSVLFIWHAAEEVGLLGSEFFMENPTVSREAMVAHINMDMVGRNHPDSLFLVGSRRLSTEFGELVEEANTGLPRPFILDYTYDAPDHPERLYCRSDHWNFARFGVPVVKMGSGLHDDYHQPSDRPALIDADKVARVAALAAQITLDVTRRVARPRVDGPAPDPIEPCEG